jgi:hypothetical protein
MAKDLGLIGTVCTVFKGPYKNWAYVLLLVGFGLTAAFLYSGWRFWIAESVNDHLHWGVATILFAIFIAMMKIWFWLQMVQKTILHKLGKL